MIARIAPSQLALFGLCGALTLVFAWEIAAPTSSYGVPRPDRAFHPAPIAFQDAPAAMSSASLDAIENRPIFSPARAPVKSKADASAAAAAFPTDVSLIGVIIDGQQKLALIKNTGAAFAGSVTEGVAIEGWTVAEIDADRIVLQSGAQKQAILLSSNRASAQSAPAVNASPPTPAPRSVPPPMSAPSVSNIPSPDNGSATSQQ